jgi:hypothetical protein
MCRAVTCKVCGKTTWAGCGQHIAQVKATIPESQWCGGEHSEAEIRAARRDRPSNPFARLFGH